jgi:hypothetical protein
VDAHYLSPQIPSSTPPPFGVDQSSRVVAVNDLADLGGAPSQFVVVGSGKTATDACIWLLGNGVDPDAICWVRPRDPWMINRALVQPDSAIFLGMVADIMEAAIQAASVDDLFGRLEDAGVMLRFDTSVTPTMAKVPTLGLWERDALRTIEQVVRLGHVERVAPTRLVCADGEWPIAPDAVVVHCAAPGLAYRPLVPIWGRTSITLQPIMAGFPCFGAALAGYVEATVDGDQDKNRLCPPSPYSDTPAQWLRMQVLGQIATASFMAHPDIRAWAQTVALNPGRTPPGTARSPELRDAVDRLHAAQLPGGARMAELAGLNP